MIMIEAPRDELLSFACDMEHELRENDSKEGWETLSVKWLLNRVKQELRELERAIQKNNKKEIISEAADTANFLMMIADKYRERDYDNI